MILVAAFACTPATTGPADAPDPVPSSIVEEPHDEPSTVEPLRRDWTIAVWMDGDNDLEPSIPKDLDELERGAVDGLTIVVEADRAPGYIDGDGDWTGTRRYEIVADETDGVDSPSIADLGEVDMGDGEALSAFLLWADATYPADHFALVLWDHGAGFSIANDDTSGSSLTLHDGELSRALQPLVDVRGPLDVVGFDACNMGQWEVADTLVGQARVLTASQAFVGYAGYAYDQAFPALPAGADARDLGDALAFSAGVVNAELTHAALSLDDVPALSAAIDTLAGVYLADSGRYPDFERARTAARGADRQWEEFWLDLGGFADAAGTSADPEIAAAGLAVREALDAAVIGNYTDPRLAFASGLTIMSDTSHPGWFAKYTAGSWATTRWDELLTEIEAWE